MAHKCPYCGEKIYTVLKAGNNLTDRDHASRKVNLEEALEMRQRGLTYAKIGDHFGVSRQAVKEILRLYFLDSSKSKHDAKGSE